MITRTNRGRRFPINWPKAIVEAEYLSTEILEQRADNAFRRYREEMTKAFSAFRHRHKPSVGIPPSWRDIARNRIHSAGIAEQYAMFYRRLAKSRRLAEHWHYEDDLPNDYPYDRMFSRSKVIDGVRMFPPIAT